MAMKEPLFPHFKALELTDRPYLADRLRSSDPTVSEMTFTNLFIWRSHYGFQWSLYKDWLFFFCADATGGAFAMQPVGPGSRKEAANVLLSWLREDQGLAEARIDRADAALVSDLGDAPHLVVEPLRDHFDYVYLREDLARLGGSKYRSKRNHINRLLRFYTATYEPFQDKYVEECLLLQDKWCQMNRCTEDLDLLGEHEAIQEILTHHEALKVDGAVIIIEGRVGAFTFGERLNHDTVVVHIEKADPEIAELYAFVNQQFCANRWTDAVYINREQDLGLVGLRDAKLSYNPDHLVEKYRIRFSG